MNKNSADAGFSGGFFNCHQFYLREIRIILVGIAIISIETTSPCRPSVKKRKAMQFNQNLLVLPIEEFQSHYILVFDLILPQGAANQLWYPDLSEKRLTLECFTNFFCSQKRK